MERHRYTVEGVTRAGDGTEISITTTVTATGPAIAKLKAYSFLRKMYQEQDVLELNPVSGMWHAWRIAD